MTTAFVYDGLNAVEELTLSAATQILAGLGLDEHLTRTDSVSGRHSVLTDALGSVLALSNDGGLVDTEYTYEPFGATTATGVANSSAAQYTGRENDSTGLYYYRARYYHPGLQRFVSEDPIGFAGGDPNLYSYVSNSPLNFTDPSGEIAPLIAAGVACGAGAVGGAAVALSGRKPTLTEVAIGAGVGCAGGLAVLGGVAAVAAVGSATRHNWNSVSLLGSPGWRREVRRDYRAFRGTLLGTAEGQRNQRLADLQARESSTIRRPGRRAGVDRAVWPREIWHPPQ